MKELKIQKAEGRVIIKNGRVLNPASKRDETADIVINNGLIENIGKNLEAGKDAEVIDAKGLIVAPGLFDMHVHFREPGREDEETIATGSRAAAAGGFTGVACMPNTTPVVENQGIVQLVKSRQTAFCGIYPVGAVTKGLECQELAEMGDMFHAGAVAVSDDGRPVTNSNLMRRALDYCRMFDIPVISHCEDLFLSADGYMNEGALATRLGLRGIPNAAESSMAYRDAQLAALTGGRLHIAHVSCAETVDVVRQAKRRGVKITAETCPHYFTLTEEAVKGYSEMTRVNPPLRGKADVQAILEGLKDGTIDCIATDHAPHSHEEKEVEFDQAPTGMIGLETSLGLCWTELVEKGVLAPIQLMEKMALNPRNILKVGNGKLETGSKADLTIFDPEAKWTVDPEAFQSKSRNTPFKGFQLKGRAVMTVFDGNIIKL
jgi:dihydroorotase